MSHRFTLPVCRPLGGKPPVTTQEDAKTDAKMMQELRGGYRVWLALCWAWPKCPDLPSPTCSQDSASALRVLCARPCRDLSGPKRIGSRGQDTYPNPKHEPTWYPPYFEAAESIFALGLPQVSGFRDFGGQTKALLISWEHLVPWPCTLSSF